MDRSLLDEGWMLYSHGVKLESHPLTSVDRSHVDLDSAVGVLRRMGNLAGTKIIENK